MSPAPAESSAPGGSATVSVCGEALVLLPEKAAFLPQHRLLLIADAHLGKASSFRHLGVPVPDGTTAENLAAIDALVARVGARHIVFLGDLLHSAHAHSQGVQSAVSNWRSRHPELRLTLVRGNHDDRAGDPPSSLGIEVVDEPLILGPWAMCHRPQPLAAGWVLAGHLHPCVRLSGPARDRLRLPCFWIRERVVVLPAFGAFTGMHPIAPERGDRVFAVTPQGVLELPR